MKLNVFIAAGHINNINIHLFMIPIKMIINPFIHQCLLFSSVVHAEKAK